MNRKQRIERIDTALAKMYDMSRSAFPRKFSWDEVQKTVARISGTRDRQVPYYAFFLPEAIQEDIVKEAIRYTRHSWRWPRRTEMDGHGRIIPDPEWDEHIEAREEMAKKVDSKEITRAEFSKWMDAEAKKYGMIRRNYDGEQIRFNIMNFAPTTNEASFDELRTLFPNAYEKWNSPENRGKEEIKFVTTEDFPEVTDADVDAKIAENKEFLGLNEWAGNKSDYASAITNPEYVRKWLEDHRIHHADYLNRTLLMMCLFWAAADQK